MAERQSEPESRNARFAPKEIEQTENRRGGLRPSLLFLLLALVLTGALAAWLGLVDSGEDIRLEIKDVAIKSEGDVELTGARYRGRTESGKQFEIIAKSAIEAANAPGIINLEDPDAKIFSGDGGVLKITSLAGTYMQSAGKVDLQGDVVVDDSTRQLIMRTQSLQADFSNGNMESATAVEVTGRDGHVVAEGMNVIDNGERIIFRGKPKMTLHNATVFE